MRAYVQLPDLVEQKAGIMVHDFVAFRTATGFYCSTQYRDSIPRCK